MNVLRVEIVPHNDQRYRTIGDWLYENGGKTLVIRVSDTGDWRSDVLIAIHEIVEAVLCQNDGVTQAQVDEFDRRHPDLDEPGNDKAAPYHQQHVVAMVIEKNLAGAMRYDWKQHEERCDATDKTWVERGQHVEAVRE